MYIYAGWRDEKIILLNIYYTPTYAGRVKARTCVCKYSWIQINLKTKPGFSSPSIIIIWKRFRYMCSDLDVNRRIIRNWCTFKAWGTSGQKRHATGRFSYATNREASGSVQIESAPKLLQTFVFVTMAEATKINQGNGGLSESAWISRGELSALLPNEYPIDGDLGWIDWFLICTLAFIYSTCTQNRNWSIEFKYGQYFLLAFSGLKRSSTNAYGRRIGKCQLTSSFCVTNGHGQVILSGDTRPETNLGVDPLGQVENRPF